MATSKIEPSRTVLLLLDLQVMYARSDPSLDELMKHVTSIVKSARSKGITIAHSRVAFTEAEAASVPDTNITFSRLKHDPSLAAKFGVDSAQAAFHPSLKLEDNDIVLRKHRVGPFFNAPQDLHAILRQRGIDTLLLGGVSTGGAVAATVIQAADLDYQLFVVEDACADPSKETHEFLMKFFAKRATVIKSEDLESFIM